MKLNEKWMLFLIATIVSFFGIFNMLTKGTKSIETNIDVETQRNALIATADAFYNQGEQLQYDSFRKQLYATPEDATSQHYVYTVCSGITFQAYYQTLGIKIPDETAALLDYAEKNKDNKSIVLRYYGSKEEIYSDDVIGTKGNPNYENLFNEWIEIVQPGDIFVFTGHAMLVHSIDKENKVVNMLDAIVGGRYNYTDRKDNYESNGTLVRSDYLINGDKHLNNLKRKLYVKYYKMNTDDITVDEMALIRFINDDMVYIDSDGKENKYTVSEAALSRLKYPDIDIEKIIKVSNGEDVVSENILTDIGESITYEITIKNNSDKDYSSFNVIENIDKNLALVDGGDGVLTDNQLKWSISSLKAGDSIKIEYTVKVPDDKSLLGKVIVSTGSVDNIATSKIETLIGNKLTKEESQKIVSTVESLKSNNQVEREFINQVYKDAVDLDLGLSNLSNLDIISYDATITDSGKDVLAVKRTKINDTAVSKYIYHNFYGLRSFYGVSPKQNNNDRNCGNSNLVRIFNMWNLYPLNEINDKVRDISSSVLLDGDIILLGTGDEKKIENEVCPVIENWVEKSYIYLNNKLIRKVAANDFEELSGDELTTFLRNMIGENFIVLRPSIAMTKQEENVEFSIEFDDSLNIDNENKYINYLVRDTLFKDLLNNIVIKNGNVKLFNSSDTEKSENDVLATGDILKVYSNDELKDEYVLSVIGDSNGDGKIDLIDLAHIRKHIVGWVNPNTNKPQYQTGVSYYALDFNKDSKVDLIDLAKMRRIIVGLS